MKRFEADHRRVRAWLTALLLVCALLWTAPTGYAEGDPVDLTRPCAVTIAPCGIDKSFRADLATADVIVDLYRIADAVAIPGDDGFDFELLSPFDTLTLPSSPSLEAWRAFSDAMGELAFDRLDTLSPLMSKPAGQRFENLPAGLYIMIAHSGGLSDYVKSVPDGAGGQIRVTYAQSVQFEYHYRPELLTLPTKDPDASGVVSTATPGEWKYDITVPLKPEQERRMGSLVIDKTLLRYAEGQEGMFVFSVDVTWNDALYSSDVYALYFTGSGSKTLRIDDLPAGAQVTVTEVYSGASYHLTTAASQTAEILADQVVHVAFTNDYTPVDREGGGIVNKFLFDGTDWGWQQLLENAE